MVLSQREGKVTNTESHEGNGEHPAAAQGVSGRGIGQWALRATLWWLASLPSGDSLTNLQKTKGRQRACHNKIRWENILERKRLL